MERYYDTLVDVMTDQRWFTQILPNRTGAGLRLSPVSKVIAPVSR